MSQGMDTIFSKWFLSKALNKYICRSLHSEGYINWQDTVLAFEKVKNI